jgi:AcrR family transcriptional regulator
MQAVGDEDDATRSQSEPPGGDTEARRVPVQQRSRERLEAILDAATAIIGEVGTDGVKMREVASRAGIPIGSLYQYFPDKSAVVRALAERYNAEGRACVERILSPVSTRAALRTALKDVVEGYYGMFLAYPVMRDIAAGMQADKRLQEIDEEDCRVHAAMIGAAMARASGGRPKAYMNEALLLTHLIAATVKLAISVKPREGRRLIEVFVEKVVSGYV